VRIYIDVGSWIRAKQRVESLWRIRTVEVQLRLKMQIARASGPDGQGPRNPLSMVTAPAMVGTPKCRCVAEKWCRLGNRSS
jgi:hypothetical protein